MAKTKPDRGRKKRTKPSQEPTPEHAQALLEKAAISLHQGQADDALSTATKALKCLHTLDAPLSASLATLSLLGEIQVELGNTDSARDYFLQAAHLDPSALIPEEAGGGADKFLWLAQLSEEGGAESVQWFEKGIVVLRREIADANDASEEAQAILETKRDKLANALCGAAEVYMTDLSWEEDAESRCEAFVTEACLVAPDSPEPLQTLASVRISQSKLEDARAALLRSLELWTELPPEDPEIPDFPTRISLARLLMEAELEDKALDVIERLVAEDDSSVEAWYLGGWCLNLLADKIQSAGKLDTDEANVAYKKLLKSSRDWLLNSLKQVRLQDYEDDRLIEHAHELVAGINGVLGPVPEEGTAAATAAEEEDDDDDEDEREGDEDEEEEDIVDEAYGGGMIKFCNTQKLTRNGN